MILIVAGEDDLHSQAVARELEAQGGIVKFLDFARFPQCAEISFEIRDGKDALTVITTEDVIHFSDVTAVLYRRPHPPAVSYPRNAAAEKYIREECTAFLESLFLLSDCRWISNPAAVKVASHKPYQLRMAQQMGFQIPASLIGNSSNMLWQFLEDGDVDFAVKPLTKPFIADNTEGKPLYTFTQKLSASVLRERASKIRACPIIVQHYIKKKLELRITVVGERVFTCAIYSQANEQTKVDWRRYNIPKTPHMPYHLPGEIEAKCVELTQMLGLEFGCIDMILTPNNQYVFVEINPVGQWLWIEELTGLPITVALAELLTM